MKGVVSYDIFLGSEGCKIQFSPRVEWFIDNHKLQQVAFIWIKVVAHYNYYSNYRLNSQ